MDDDELRDFTVSDEHGFDIRNGQFEFKLIVSSQPTACVALPFEPVCALGDFVWYDDNRNGIQDRGERGVPNVRVSLREKGNGNDEIARTFTDADGHYLFSSASMSRNRIEKERMLCNTRYELVVSMSSNSPLERFVVTKAFRGSDTARDSNGVSDGHTAVANVQRSPDFGETDLSYDFGFYREK